jgi:hypothetical protein
MFSFPNIVCKHPVVLIYCTMFRFLTNSDHQLYRVWVLETPFGLLIRFYLQSHTFVTTITIIPYAFARLHNYNSYTPIFHSIPSQPL